MLLILYWENKELTEKPILNEIHNPSFDTQVLQRCEIDTLNMISNFGNQFTDDGCPVCASNKRHLEETVWGLNYQRCEVCGLVYISPCPTNEIRSWYLENSTGLKFWRENMPKKTIDSRYALYSDRAEFIDNAVTKFGVNHNRIVEVGAGNGELAKIISERGLFSEIILVEPQPLQISLPACKVVQAEISDANLSEPADVVVAFEVLEHINEPKEFLHDLGNLVGEDGLLIMSTPNVDGLEISCLGQLSNALKFDHVRLYSPHSIRRLLDNEGWELLHIETPGLFDVDSICNHFENGAIDLASNPALRFICESNIELRSQFQLFLQQQLLSSHMKFVARKCRVT